MSSLSRYIDVRETNSRLSTPLLASHGTQLPVTPALTQTPNPRIWLTPTKRTDRKIFHLSASAGFSALTAALTSYSCSLLKPIVWRSSIPNGGSLLHQLLLVMVGWRPELSVALLGRWSWVFIFNYLHTMAIFLEIVTSAIILYRVLVVYSASLLFFLFSFPPLFWAERGLPSKYVLFLGSRKSGRDRACARRGRFETPSSLGRNKLSYLVSRVKFGPARVQASK